MIGTGPNHFLSLALWCEAPKALQVHSSPPVPPSIIIENLLSQSSLACETATYLAT